MRFVRRSFRACAVAPGAAFAPMGAGAQSVATRVRGPIRDQAFRLSIENITRGPELVGEASTGARRTDDSRRVYFRWPR